ncbi:glycosyltransferase family 4 protein [Phenylobacterium sp. J367]|uniref:glycosyltransferase family 4 protein n=1 Tax=Phenylobacterium sp. J367 TaxID=2898435 RepID=UPI002150FB39|nr:glycosyltransferase family 4 protein [Phenylobacterium sp. J367]MCR5879503.1 glycosyltransferase family 4 protein [Phenylobacterium sp. J367]
MRLYGRATRLQAVSTTVAAAIASQTPSMANRVVVLPNAVAEEFLRNPNPPQALRRNQILYVGRIAREKGLHHLVSAFREVRDAYPEWTLRLVGPHTADGGGDGPAYLAELRRLAVGDPRIAFEGASYSPEALAAHMRQSSIFVYPSISERGESFGLAPLEAMGCGCAVLVSNLACFGDFLVAGVNGDTFDHRQEGHLAVKLRDLLGSPALRARLSASAQLTAQRYSTAEVSHLFLTEFQRTISHS